MNEEDEGWWSYFKWVPTSAQILAQAEQKMLEIVRKKFDNYFVNISESERIHTLARQRDDTNHPLLLLHGFGAGVGFWNLNLDRLADEQTVYAIDLLGFGRSSRPTFPLEAHDAENLFVESIEMWRRNEGVDKFTLLGHSFGAYLACAYSLKYPERVAHLILADPWGIAEKPVSGEVRIKIPVWAKVIAALVSPFNPLAALRVAGPWGPVLINRARSDIQKKFVHVFGENDHRVMDYLYHCNVQNPRKYKEACLLLDFLKGPSDMLSIISGESAFKTLSVPYGWAKYPMIHRIKDLHFQLHMTVIYGSRTWMDTSIGNTIKYLRENSEVDVQIIQGAGHHVFMDRPSEFNEAVLQACRKANGGEYTKEDNTDDGDNYGDNCDEGDNNTNNDGDNVFN